MGGTEGQFINNSDNGEGRGLVLLKLRCTKQWAKIENLKEKKRKILAIYMTFLKLIKKEILNKQCCLYFEKLNGPQF